MRFQKIFVEEQVRQHPQTLGVLKTFPNVPVSYIRKIEDIFGRVKKPYLQKRRNLNLFIGRKEGQLVKPAPDAYGLAGDPHYYFIHSYNCIYECEYCYLQGYFNSPDIVFFVNHDEIAAEMESICDKAAPGATVWFHAGEFSDSLALAHITNELPHYWRTFEKLDNARLELRTKSVNIRPLLALGPRKNIIVTFSVAPESSTRKYDHKTPTVNGRLKAMKQLADAGFQLGIHMDPIIYSENFRENYADLIQQISAQIPFRQIEYISLGVVRFTRDVFREFTKNYPASDLNSAELAGSFDGKVRYRRPHRLFILKSVRGHWTAAGFPEDKIYLCMENESAQKTMPGTD